MRLLYLTRKYPPAVGGMERMNHELVTALRPLTDLQLVAWGRGQWGLPWFALTAALRILPRLARPARRPDVLCLGDAALSPLGRALARPWRVPVVVIAHGLDVTFPRYGYPRLVLPALRRCERVICVSRYTEGLCADRGVPPERLRVIPNGIRLPDGILDRAPARASLRQQGWPTLGTDPFLLTVGRLVPRKGVAQFIRQVLPALRRQFPALKYGVIGRGPDEAAIRGAIAETGAQACVILRNGVDDETVRQAYAAADLFVMYNQPVTGNPEGFGIVALEASACGLPVMATALEGLTDAVQDGVNGHSIAPGDPAAFAAVTTTLLADPAARADLGRRARAFALDHTWDKIARRYQTVFQEVISPTLDTKP